MSTPNPQFENDPNVGQQPHFEQHAQPTAQPSAQTDPNAQAYAGSQPYSGGTSYDQQQQQGYGYQQSYPGGYAQQGYGYAGQQSYTAGVAPKSKVAAALLGIFLGTFGVHNFYLGHTTKAVVQLLLTVLSLGTLSWISWIWGIIEGILILTSQPGTEWHRDARGVELTD